MLSWKNINGHKQGLSIKTYYRHHVSFQRNLVCVPSGHVLSANFELLGLLCGLSASKQACTFFLGNMYTVVYLHALLLRTAKPNAGRNNDVTNCRSKRRSMFKAHGNRLRDDDPVLCVDSRFDVRFYLLLELFIKPVFYRFAFDECVSWGLKFAQIKCFILSMALITVSKGITERCFLPPFCRRWLFIVPRALSINIHP